jgi:transcription termination factor NusB
LKNCIDIILRKNIEKKSTEDGEIWECEEKQFRCNKSLVEEEIKNNFNFYWNLADGITEEEAVDETAKEVGEPTLIKRLDAVESAILELAEVMSDE